MSIHMATTTIKVDGMTCGACTSAVESGFSNVDGVGAVSVSLVLGRAVVHHDPTKISAEQVAEIMEDRGFDAEVLSSDVPTTTQKPILPSESTPSASITTISIDGMTCGACTSAVEAGFKDVGGIKTVSISLLAGRAVVEHDASIISPHQIAEIIEDRGFDATVTETKEQTAVVSSAGVATSTAEMATDVWTSTIAVDGMTCGACTSAVEGAFKDMPGLVRFNISLLAGRAVITHKASSLSAETIVQTIEDAGFDAKLISTQPENAQHLQTSSSVQLKIYGVPDRVAATALEDLLRQKNGINSAVISLSTSRATIQYDPASIGLRVIVATIEEAGYNALVADSDDNNAQLESLAKTKEIQEWKTAFITSLSFAVPVFCISMIIPMFFPRWMNFGAWQIIPGLLFGDILCGILAAPVQFGIGKRFYISAYKSLKHRSPTMDVLVVLGTSAAYFFSCFAILIAVLIPPHNKPGAVFDTSTMLITFITLGRWLENRAKGQTSKALSQLMSLAPSMATIYEDPLYAEKLAEEWKSFRTQSSEKSGYSIKQDILQGDSAAEKVIPTELIELGDIVLLRPGDKVPADGLVIRGESFVDESMVTGEAVPVMKKKDSALIAGTVNGAGRLDFKVTRAGKDTQLSQIVNLVQEAQTSRAPIQRMADLVAGYFVPIIILLGLITFVGWMALSHMLPHPPQIFLDPQSGGKFMVCLKLCISVIVFACPCALGLATPTAVMVGTGTASQKGILVKGGAALETATRITHIVFDKTGTLTFGKLHVAEVEIKTLWRSTELTRRIWWNLVGLTESGSEHPIGKSILTRVKEELGLAVEQTLPGRVGTFDMVVGRGVSAEVEILSEGTQFRHQVHIGNANFLKISGITMPVDFELENSHLESKTDNSSGMTYVYIAIDAQYAGGLGLSDTLKPTAAATITALHKMGISTSLVTGDTIGTALVIASRVGIPTSSVHASVSPSDKQSIVASLQSSGEIVAMVGDGINDSPALATANVGIGLVSGSDIAVEAADVVIMRADDLLHVPLALQLCRTIFTRIKMNLVWACGYNLIGLPFAMGLLLPFGYHMPPLASAVAMMFSSISVTLSSLALKWAAGPAWLTVENLEMEGGKIAVPTLGDWKGGKDGWEAGGRRGGMLTKIGAKAMGVFDVKLGMKRRMGGTMDETERGSYVALRNVDVAPV